MDAAYGAYVQVMAAVIGAAALEAGERAEAQNGQSIFIDLASASEALPPAATPLVRQLVGDGRVAHPDRFEVVRTVIASLGAVREKFARP